MAVSNVPQTARPAVKLNAIASARHKLSYCQHHVIGETVIIASATTIGRFYVVTARGCECEGAKRGIKCWHTVARELVLANGTQPGPRTAEEIDEAEDRARAAAIMAAARTKQYTQADYDELFS